MAAKRKTAKKPVQVLTISSLVDSLEKASNTQTAAVGGLNTRLKDVCSKAKSAKIKEEVATESNLASRLAKVLHQMSFNTARIEDITSTINL